LAPSTGGSHTLHDKARDQGLGYADSAAIRAPFFLYTNGEKWHAYHKVKDLWTAVDDLPLWNENDPSRGLVDILDSIYSLKPILYKLDEPVVGHEAECFLEHLQRFFVHSNTLLRSVDEKAIEGADHLLRALLDKTQHLNYRVQKLTFAFRDWESFREHRDIGRKIEVADFDGRLRPLLSAFHYSLDSLLPHLVRPPSFDALVLRFCVALLAYGVTNENGKEGHIPITQAVHQTLRDLLNAVLSEKFQCQLPDIVDRDANSRMKADCHHAWDEYIERGKLS
jgi:hypothetical protein